MEHSGRTDGIDGFNQPSCHPHLMQTGNSCGGKYEQCKDYNDPNYVFTCDDEDYINNNLNKFSWRSTLPA